MSVLYHIVQRMPKHFLQCIAICKKTDYNNSGDMPQKGDNNAMKNKKCCWGAVIAVIIALLGAAAAVAALLHRHHTACCEELEDEDLVEYLNGEEHEDTPEQ